MARHWPKSPIDIRPPRAPSAPQTAVWRTLLSQAIFWPFPRLIKRRGASPCALNRHRPTALHAGRWLPPEDRHARITVNRPARPTALRRALTRRPPVLSSIVRPQTRRNNPPHLKVPSLAIALNEKRVILGCVLALQEA